MNKAISSKQLSYSVGSFIIASSLLTSNLYYFVKNESWISVIIGFLASLIIVAMYIRLSKQYPGQSIIEINDAVFGKYLGKVVSVCYIFYFLSLACFNTRDLGDFVKSAILPNTPIVMLFIIFVSVCAFAVKKGPVNMTSYAVFSAVIAISAIAVNSLLLIDKTELKNLLPVFELPLINYMIGAHIVTMLPFCEIISFMMFIPYLQKQNEFGKAMRHGLMIGAVTLMFIVLRDITVLGSFTALFSMPTFSSIRYIDIGDILTRLEIIYALILMGLLFFKVSVVYYAAVSCFTRMLKIDSYKIFVNAFGALTILYASASFISASEHGQWNLTAAATYSSFFILILPVITLVVSFVQKTKRKQTVQNQA